MLHVINAVELEDIIMAVQPTIPQRLYDDIMSIQTDMITSLRSIFCSWIFATDKLGCSEGKKEPKPELAGCTR